MSQNPKKLGSKVFKKSSPNGKITVYLGKRDFVDHGTHVDLIDGVVLVDPDYLKDRKVFGHVLAAFRYGKEECDVLGATFRKTLYQSSSQIYPLSDDSETAKRPLTRLQERLVKKLGSNAFPFFYSLPSHCPASVTLQPAPGDTGKPCGIDYEMKAYVGDMVEDLPNKRNSVTLAIRKVTYAPSNYGDQPSVEVSKVFMMSQNKLHLECSLDKELYHHGERISVNVHLIRSFIITERGSLSMFTSRTTPTGLSRRQRSQSVSLQISAIMSQGLSTSVRWLKWSLLKDFLLAQDQP